MTELSFDLPISHANGWVKLIQADNQWQRVNSREVVTTSGIYGEFSTRYARTTFARNPDGRRLPSGSAPVLSSAMERHFFDFRAMSIALAVVGI